MTVINQNNYNLVLNYSPELIHILKQFFTSAEHRNEGLRVLIENLQKENGEVQNSLLPHLLNHWEETEVDIELVKKLLP